ncbi:hypothetical protein KIW84_061367 [Lathyrus oleraceus]|uniref:Uncharacterized protein n=1 Tax=Pisum sativum TaxID=3888 RepID=A0A9D4W5L4_PEA|nr:hypothetical protein KIW84_061367 [Pisum sativum]
MSRDIVIDENSVWDCNSSDTIDKPLESYDFDEASSNVEVKDIVDILVEVEAATDMPDIVEVEDCVTSTSQRAQRTRVHPVRLQDYEVIGDDEVTPNGELVYLSLLAGT